MAQSGALLSISTASKRFLVVYVKQNRELTYKGES